MNTANWGPIKWSAVLTLEILCCVGLFFSGVLYKSIEKDPKPEYAALANGIAWEIVQFKNAGCAITSGPVVERVVASPGKTDIFLTQACNLKTGTRQFRALIHSTSNSFVSPTGKIISNKKENVS